MSFNIINTRGLGIFLQNIQHFLGYVNANNFLGIFSQIQGNSQYHSQIDYSVSGCNPQHLNNILASSGKFLNFWCSSLYP
jgi:hypothetical protein